MSHDPNRRTSRWIQAADAFTIGLLLVAAFAIVHPLRIDVMGITIRIRQWWRLVLIAGGVAFARRWMWPTPTFGSRLVARWNAAQAVWPTLAATLPIAAVTRLLVLFIGYFSVVTFGLKPDAPRTMGWDFGPQLPLRWDAGWYLGIASNGYRWTGRITDQQNLNFFPAYPFAVRYVSWALHLKSLPEEMVQAWTATVLSMVAFLLACLYLYRLVADRFGADVASGTILLTATYPFALFYSAVYPEALFLLCAVGAWYHMEREQTLPMALWGLFAGLCRPNGGLLTLALVAWVATERRHNRRLLLASVAPLVGTGLFTLWEYQLTGHPIVWAELQRSAFMRTYRGLDETLWTPIKSVLDDGALEYIRSSPWEMTNLLAALLGACAVWPVTRRIGVAAGLFVAINVFVPLLNGGLVSMGRYTTVLFPMFVWLALSVRGRSLALLASCFGLLQGVLAALFFTWRPIF